MSSGNVERSPGFHIKGLRLHAEEMAIINQACEALDIDRATLIGEAALFETTRLGIRYTVEDTRPLRSPWPFLPQRHGDEPTGVKISTTISRTLAELTSRAAHHVDASEPQFLIGATLAYIGRIRKTFHGASEPTPEVAAKIRRKLAAIKLPRQYQYRPEVQ